MKKMTSKAELERSVLEMTRVAKRLVNLTRTDPLQAGAYKAISKRLTTIEKTVRGQKRKGLSQEELHEIARKLAQLVGNLCKLLIRCLYPFNRLCTVCAFS